MLREVPVISWRTARTSCPAALLHYRRKIFNLANASDSLRNLQLPWNLQIQAVAQAASQLACDRWPVELGALPRTDSDRCHATSMPQRFRIPDYESASSLSGKRQFVYLRTVVLVSLTCWSLVSFARSGTPGVDGGLCPPSAVGVPRSLEHTKRPSLGKVSGIWVSKGYRLRLLIRVGGVCLALCVCMLLLDYFLVEAKNRRVAKVVTRQGGRMRSLPVWPLGAEYWISFPHPLGSQELDELMELNTLRGSVVVAFVDCNPTQNQIHEATLKLRNCRLRRVAGSEMSRLGTEKNK